MGLRMQVRVKELGKVAVASKVHIHSDGPAKDMAGFSSDRVI